MVCCISKTSHSAPTGLVCKVYIVICCHKYTVFHGDYQSILGESIANPFFRCVCYAMSRREQFIYGFTNLQCTIFRAIRVIFREIRVSAIRVSKNRKL